MTLQEFQNWALSQKDGVATPIGTYLGECVSLVQQYLSQAYGIPFQARGHAKDWATNENVLSYFDKVPSPQAGDIGISGPTKANPYGHIWIYTSPTTILEQNGRVSRRVSTGAAYNNPIAILRRKGTDMEDPKAKADAGGVRALYLAFLGREPDAHAKGYEGKAWPDVIYALYTSPEYKERVKRLAALEASGAEMEEVGNNTGLFQRKKK